MSSAKDVDDCILDQAGSLLPYVRMNGHQYMAVGCLSEVPWLLVLLFELLTTETIAADLKPFSCLDEQAHTLQTIIDTLEQTLRLPMNHITGMGVAKLERRQLSDALQIFADLIKHCYPYRRNDKRRGRGRNSKSRGSSTPEGRRLTLSQLESPDLEPISFSHSCTPVLSAFSLGGNRTVQEKHNANMCQAPTKASMQSHKSTVQSVRTLNHDSNSRSISSKENPTRLDIHDDENRTEQLSRNFAILLEDSLSSSSSSTTSVKQTDRHIDAIAAQDRDRFNDAPNINRVENKTLSTQVFKPHMPSISLLNTNKSTQSKCIPNKQQHGNEIAATGECGRDRNMSSVQSTTCRYAPYNPTSRQTELTKYELTPKASGVSSPKPVIKYANKVVQPNYNNLKRKTSTTTVRNPPQRSFCRKPSVKSFKSPSKSTLRRRPSTEPQGTPCAKSTNPSVRDIHKSKAASTMSRASLSYDCRRGAITAAETNATKEQHTVPKRPRKPSVMKSNTKASVGGVAKKPPAPLVRKPSARVAVSISGQTGGSKSSSRRIDAITTLSRDPGRRYVDGGNGRERREQKVDKYVLARSCNEHDSRMSPVSYRTSQHDRRRPSIVSTKVRKHSCVAPISPVAFDNLSRSRKPVRRGKVSPQTTSLCSSIKLLEEFDYVKRRLNEIQVEEKEHEEAIRQLQHERVRLEHVLSYVQGYAGSALRKESSERTDVFKAAA